MNTIEIKKKLEDLKNIGFIDEIDRINDINQLENIEYKKNKIKIIIYKKDFNSVILYNNGFYFNIIYLNDNDEEIFEKKLIELYNIELELEKIKIPNNIANKNNYFIDSIYKLIYIDNYNNELSINDFDDEEILFYFNNFKNTVVDKLIPLYNKENKIKSYLLPSGLFTKYLDLIFDIDIYCNDIKSSTKKILFGNCLSIYELEKTIKTGKLYALFLTENQYKIILDSLNNEYIKQNNKDIINYLIK